MVNLKVNGKAYQLDVDPSTPILCVIRDNIGLTGTKFGCGATDLSLQNQPRRNHY